MVGADRQLACISRTPSAVKPRPLALGYLRLHASGPPEIGAALTAELRAYADREGLTLADVYVDLFDPPASNVERAGFCALMDAVRRHEVHAVIIPGAEHLSRRPSDYIARRTIIVAEGGARLLRIHGSGDLP